MEFSIFKDIVIIFGLSTVVNFIFTKIKLPTLIGYLLTGIIAGPHLLGLIHAEHEIELMAEIGVVLLMFTIGLEFSIKHLIKIRKVVFLGGLLQMLLTTLLIFFCFRFLDISWQSSVFIGVLVALSSTAIVLKLLQDRSELTSYYGRTVLGILIFQDIIIVPLMLLTPILGGQTNNIIDDIMWLTLKSIVVMVGVYAGHKWIMPQMLHKIAMTKNQELFLMSILWFCLAVALLTSSLGMSLAFGAFLAGLMISESEYSHTAFGNLIPFKDTFTSFFFVSIGMMLDINFVIGNATLVLFALLVVLSAKTFVAGATAFLLGHSFIGTVTVGMGLSQVGEFSFILAQQGANFGLLDSFYFQLFLAVAVLSMIVSPFMIQSSHAIANFFLRFRLPKWWVDGLFPVSLASVPELHNHIVLIGKDTRAANLADMIGGMGLPFISVIFDPGLAQERQKNGDFVIYGDATNQSILHAASIANAEVIIVSVGDLIASMAIVENIRKQNKHSHIIVRTKDIRDIQELYRLGANQVIPEKFETAIELFEQLLKKMLIPRREINTEVATIRETHYGKFSQSAINKNLNLPCELPNIEVTSIRIDASSPVANKSLIELSLRKEHGITLVAIHRGNDIIEHPDSVEILEPNDVAYIMGRAEQIENAFSLFTNEP